MPQIVAIVPARHHSQRVPGKNYRLLGPYPLYYHILSTLTSIPSIDQVIVDTDSDVISDGLAKWFPQINVLRRPQELCAPEISMNQILLSIVQRLELAPETIVFQTHVTNPFLKVTTIFNMLNCHPSDGSTTMTVTEYKKRLWTGAYHPINHDPQKLLQTQDLQPFYEENSCAYIFQVSELLATGNRLGKKQKFYPLELGESLDIDTEEDFQLAEAWYRHQAHLSSSNQISSEAPKVHSDEEVYSALRTALSNYNNFTGYRVLISAPYMMPNISAFRRYLENDLGMRVIVAPVRERLSEEELMNYNGLYDLSLIGDDHYTERVIKSCGAKCISKWGTGIDSINQEACRKYDIPLKNTPDAFSIPVAESILAALLGFFRQTYCSTQQMSYTADWVKFPGRILGEVTIGVIGYGNVGKQVVADLVNLGTRQIYVNDPYVTVSNNSKEKQVDLEVLLAESDAVCVCCDFRNGNHHLIGRRELIKMKSGSYLINMARGGLVDLQALNDALEAGHLAGAALDVFELEPLSGESSLRRRPNVLLSSHNANSSPKHWMRVHINTIRQGLDVLRVDRLLKEEGN